MKKIKVESNLLAEIVAEVGERREVTTRPVEGRDEHGRPVHMLQEELAPRHIGRVALSQGVQREEVLHQACRSLRRKAYGSLQRL